MSHHRELLNAPSELPELDKFKSLLILVHTSGDTMVTCRDLVEAKLLRRRFYRLREKLVGHERSLADAIAFSLIGRRVRCSRRNDFAWTEQPITLGATNETSTEGSLPESNRLDDKG